MSSPISQIRIRAPTDYGRVLQFDSAAGRVETPTRVITTRELRYARDLPNELIPQGWSPQRYDHQIVEIVQHFGRRGGIRALRRKNGRYEDLRRDLRKEAALLPGRLLAFFPRISSEHTDKIGFDDLKHLINLESEIGGINLVGIPDPHHGRWNEAEFREDLNRCVQYISRTFGSEALPLPYIRLDQPAGDILYPKFNWFVENSSQYPMIALVSLGDTYAARVTAEEILKDNEIIVHMANVDREIVRERIPVARPHILPVQIADSVSIRKAYGGGGGRTSKTPRMAEDVSSQRVPTSAEAKEILERRTTLRRFDGSALGYLTEEKHEELFGDKLACECFLCKGKTREEFFDSIQPLDPLKQSAALRIHEVHASLDEFAKARDELLHDDYRRYLLAKPLVRQHQNLIPEVHRRLDRFE